MADHGRTVVHVVRRFGPVGGAERYVYELTRERAALGRPVITLCAKSFAAAPPGVTVHELGDTIQRPRWLCQWRFRAHVRAFLARERKPDWLVHSHERLDSHDLSTYHGPPFATVLERPLWRRLSLRVAAQLDLERRELGTARLIVPNSPLIRAQLAHYYPQHAPKLSSPITPGVDAVAPRPQRAVDPQGGVVGFVGREWRRKGLPLAVEAVARLRRKRPRLELHVVGAAPREVEPLFGGWKHGCRLIGWRAEPVDYHQFDVLLHPARAEPYGMVITEAMAARVPVVVSDACGAAAEVAPASGRVVPLEAPPERWVEALEAELSRNDPPPAFARRWRHVAEDYERLYLSFETSVNG